MTTMRTAELTIKLEELDRILAKLIELGVDKNWLIEANQNTEGARQLLKGILYLREMYAEPFKGN
ncbi:MAG: hypothetical protein E6K92_09405 [Thaumarchaeota archaeon]|nr:MAG: hypothetical protein E6K92_09405 [Nitrososphaerota archaeon]